MKIAYDDLDTLSVARISRAMEELLPRVLPADWRRTEEYVNAAWYSSQDGLRVCTEVESQDGDIWLHVSLSRSNRDPSYFDMKRVKDLFVGCDRKAIQVFPPEAEHYSFHPHCLHMWAPVDKDPLPDFRNHAGRL